MRTSGDDVGELLALLGVRPVWDDASRRVSRTRSRQHRRNSAAPVSTWSARISGFFRDAFPHVVTMMDDAVQLVAEPGRTRRRAEPDPRAAPLPSLANHDDWRRATTRIFGSPPGSYGAGICCSVDRGPLLARRCRPGRGLCRLGRSRLWPRPRRNPAGPRRHGVGLLAGSTIAVKNLDTREHDIADSDDYYQYHGGMIATVKRADRLGPQGLCR